MTEKLLEKAPAEGREKVPRPPALYSLVIPPLFF